MSDEQDEIPTGAEADSDTALAPDAPPAADTTANSLGLEEMASQDADQYEAATEKSASDLEAVFDVPVRISVILGRTKMPVANLLKMDVGTVVELDRQVGEAIDIYVNERLVARGEIVLVEDRLGVTMTEIIKAT